MTQIKSDKIIIFFSILLLLSSEKIWATSPLNLKKLVQATLVLDDKTKLTTYIVKSLEDHKKGLSFIKSSDFSDNEALFFYYPTSGLRRYWMPNTFFNLDIFFLNEKLEVVAAERNMKAFPHGSSPKRKIDHTRIYRARHVFEMKSRSKLAKKIKVGTKLNWRLPAPF